MLPSLDEGGAEAELAIALPATRQGDLSLCPSGRCSVSLRPSEVEVTAASDDELSVSVAVRAAALGVPVRYEQSWPCAFTGRPACTVSVDTTRAGVPHLTASARIGLSIDPRTGLLALTPRDAQITHGLDGGDVRIVGANTCGRVWCTAANLTGVTGILVDRANVALGDAVAEQLSTLACTPCEAGCRSGYRCVAGICREPRSQACQPAPLAMGVALASPDQARQVRLDFALGDAVGARHGGLETALRIAASSSQRHRCVPPADAPRATPLPRAVLDRGSEAEVHARVAVAESALARAAWAAQQAGIGCADLGLEELPSFGLRVLLPTVRRLDVFGVGEPRISVRPLEPPVVTVEESGALRLTAARVRVDIGAGIDGRMLRLASTELTLGVTASLQSEEGQLFIALDAASVEVVVGDVWGAPLLGADREGLELTYDALTALVRAAIPPRVPLTEEALPGGLRFVGTPRRVIVDGVTAIVADLRLGPS